MWPGLCCPPDEAAAPLHAPPGPPAPARRPRRPHPDFGIDPHRVAIGGISISGFGAYDLALLHPHRFCAVGGHSPALWFEGGETAPGAYDDAADFTRNDVVGMARGNPDAFAGMRVWNDYGDEDPFLVYDEGFVDYLRQDGADLSAQNWHGGNAHWAAYLRFYANALSAC